MAERGRERTLFARNLYGTATFIPLRHMSEDALTRRLHPSQPIGQLLHTGPSCASSRARVPRPLPAETLAEAPAAQLYLLPTWTTNGISAPLALSLVAHEHLPPSIILHQLRGPTDPSDRHGFAIREMTLCRPALVALRSLYTYMRAE